EQSSQEIRYMPDIKPGLHVEFFYHSDYEEENIHVMRSILYDRSGRRITLAQTSPAILSSSVRKGIIVTYMIRKDGEPSRLGFPAKILSLETKYVISSGEKVPVIVIEKEGDPRPFNVRFFFRLRVPSSSDLVLYIRGQRVNIIDISLGGAMISSKNIGDLQMHQHVRLTVRFESKSYDAEAEILRLWSPDFALGRHGWQFAALKFINVPMSLEGSLGRFIFAIERQQLARDAATTSWRR
ncbi:MAG: PilZ domain-containing protein, partial [Syntrophales bacterium]|nr:PilZ domain-containing protein [Syntrophales bacterium]